MVTVCVKQLISAIGEAEAFKFPEMNKGTEYIYGSLYLRLTRGEELDLSEIDFGRFDIDDIDAMRDLYTDTIYENECKTEIIRCSLSELAPVAAKALFV